MRRVGGRSEWGEWVEGVSGESGWREWVEGVVEGVSGGSGCMEGVEEGVERGDKLHYTCCSVLRGLKACLKISTNGQEHFSIHDVPST